MKATDWESHYVSGDTPWEKGEPSPGLVDFLETGVAVPGQTVCVPGCGTGHDVRAWAGAGLECLGVDMAPSAVRMAGERTDRRVLKAEFRCMDFLAEPVSRQFDWLFEHTLFCAINPDRRADYLTAILRWLKPGGRFLAVHYMIPDTDGPPFGTTSEEVESLFSPHFELVRQWVPRSYPNRTGLERCYLWDRSIVSKKD